jgi:hypothetical protein
LDNLGHEVAPQMAREIVHHVFKYGLHPCQ